MPRLSWKECEPARTDREYVVLASHLPLRRLGATWRFLGYVRSVRRQLASTPGLIGYSLWAKPLARDYWTLSVWDDDTSLRDFVGAAPHADVMRALATDMSQTKFAQWSVSGKAVPVAWGDAIDHLDAQPS